MNRYTSGAVFIVTIILQVISLFHFYWAFGGTLWYDDVLPTNSMGTKKLNPSTTATLVVAFGLLLMAFFIVATRGFFARRYFFRSAVKLHHVLVRSFVSAKFTANLNWSSTQGSTQ